MGRGLGRWVCVAVWLVSCRAAPAQVDAATVGQILDSHRGIAVYDNGPEIDVSHGRSRGTNGAYYGKKWQCVEYVKRFYGEVLGHQMPDGWGHAKSFFDESVPDGGCNRTRGLLQYGNGSRTPPRPDDILVFNEGSLGHVAIVTEVRADSLEVIQQNVPGSTREEFEFREEDGHIWIRSPYRPAGWLRRAEPVDGGAGCP